MCEIKIEIRTLNLTHNFDGQTNQQVLTTTVSLNARNGRILSLIVNGKAYAIDVEQERIAEDTYDGVNVVINWAKPHPIDGYPDAFDDLFKTLSLDKVFKITPREVKYFNQRLVTDYVPFEVVGRRGKTIFVLREMKVENEYSKNPIITPNRDDYPTQEIRVSKGKRIGHDINSDHSVVYFPSETPYSYTDPYF